MDAFRSVLTRLADAKRSGEPFDTAWPRAVADFDDADRDVLEQTCDAWRRSYTNAPAEGAESTTISRSMIE